ncbi:hypothetical protein RFI_02639, partial [Reticulomyxa filosa]
YVLVHPDIHSCVIDQFKQLKCKPHDNLYADRIFPRLHIFRKTSDIDIQYFELLLRRCGYYYCKLILEELTEDQLNDAIKILISALSETDIREKSETDIREKSAKLLLEVGSKLNEQQAKYVFLILMTGINYEKNEHSCGELLASIAIRLGGKYLEDAFEYGMFFKDELEILLIKLHEGERNENVFQYLINGLDNPIADFSRLCAKVLEKISMKLKEEHLNVALRRLSRRLRNTWILGHFSTSFEKISVKLNEEQLQYSFQCLIDGLEDEDRLMRIECAKMLVKLSIKWNQVQLDYAFRCLICGLNDRFVYVHKAYAELLVAHPMKWSQVQFDDAFKCLVNRLNEDIGWGYIYPIKIILMKLKDEYLDIAFKNLMDGLNNNKQRIRKECVDLLTAASMQWNKIQLDTLFVRLTMKESKDRDEHVRYSCAKAIQELLLQLDDKQINEAFGYLISGFKDKNKNVQCLCAKSLGKIVEKLNRIQLNIAFQCVMKKFNDKNEDIIVRKSSAESIVSIAVKLSEAQLNDASKCLVDRLNDEQEDELHEYCAYWIDKLLMKLNGIDENTLSLRESLEATLTIFEERQCNDEFMWLFNMFKKADSIKPHYSLQLSTLFWEPNGRKYNSAFKGKNEHVRNLCAYVIKGIALKLNEKQMDEVFEYFPFDRDHHILFFYLDSDDIDKRIHNFNDKQLYLFTKFYSQFLKKDNKVIEILLRISDDMWQRVIMYMLKMDTPRKEKEKRKFIDKKYTQQNQLNGNKEMNNINDIHMEILVLFLWAWIPRIQFNSNDKNLINSDAFNKLLQCCNEKAIRWKFPIEQKWNVDDNDIPHPRCDTSKPKDRYNVVCESARLGDMSQLTSALQDHRIDINDAFNEYGNAPLILAINNKRWDIARYCIEQGAWIDVRGGAFNENTSQTPVECM